MPLLTNCTVAIYYNQDTSSKRLSYHRGTKHQSHIMLEVMYKHSSSWGYNPQAHWRFGWTKASASLLPSWGRATVRFWPATFTISDNNSLQCVLTAEAMMRWHSIFFFAAHRTRRHALLPTTSTQLILDACGPFWNQSGPWHAPPPDREWEREREGERALGVTCSLTI